MPVRFAWYTPIACVVFLSFTAPRAQPPEFPAAGAAVCPAEAAFGQVVTLSGLARGGSIDSYRWVQFDDGQGPPVTLSAEDVPVTSFVAPSEPAVLSFLFSASAAAGGERVTDTVSVRVSEEGSGLPRMAAFGEASGTMACSQADNVAAVARVADSVRVEGGVAHTIGATEGRDPDDTRVFIGGLPRGGVSYLWSVVEGGGVLTDDDLIDADTATVGFTAPAVTERTELTLSLLVADVADCGTRYQVRLVVEPRPLECPEASPVALARVIGVANGQRVVRVGDEFTLDASRSGVPNDDGAPLTYSWSQTGGEAVLARDLSSAQARVRVEQVATAALEFRVTVEGELGSDEATLLVPAVSDFLLFFSQIAFGSAGSVELGTVPILINDSEDLANVRIEFFDQQGQSLDLLLEGEPWDAESTLVIPARSARQLAFSAVSNGAPTVGWARVTTDQQLTGLVLYQLNDRSSPGVGFELGLFASTPGARITTFFGRDDGLAVAVANPGNQAANVLFEVLGDPLGTETPVAMRNVVLGPGQQLAQFLDAEFLGGLPDGFQEGTLVVRELEERSIVATVLKTDPLGFLTSTLPVAVRRGESGVIAGNDPPVARLRVATGDPTAEPQPVADGDRITVSPPAEVRLDGSTSSDELGAAGLRYDFRIDQSFTAGGAILTFSGESSRTLQIAEGSVGSITVTLVVTDPFGASDSTALTIDVQ